MQSPVRFVIKNIQKLRYVLTSCRYCIYVSSRMRTKVTQQRLVIHSKLVTLTMYGYIYMTFFNPCIFFNTCLRDLGFTFSTRITTHSLADTRQENTHPMRLLICTERSLFVDYKHAFYFKSSFVYVRRIFGNKFVLLAVRKRLETRVIFEHSFL